jgi:hypothetical protein
MVAWLRLAVPVGLLLAACTGSPPAAPSIRADATIDVMPSDPASRRARAIAEFIQRKYALVEVWNVSSVDGGEVIAYAVRMRLDRRSDHPDFEDWQAHVSGAARDQRQAAVEMLQITVLHLPQARLVSVFQDDFLQPHWTRRQIRQMDEPRAYRTFEAWRDLVLSAAVLPGVAGG